MTQEQHAGEGKEAMALGAVQPCDTCGASVPVNAVSPSECFCSAECMDASGVVTLERWGLCRIGINAGFHVRLDDGYWTPWHVAAERIAALEAALAQPTPQGEDTAGQEDCNGPHGEPRG